MKSRFDLWGSRLLAAIGRAGERADHSIERRGRDPLYQAVVLFLLGAFFGAVFWADEKLCGDCADYANAAPKGFTWNVVGTGVLFLALWACYHLGVAIAIWCRPSIDVDPNHAPHCAHRSRRVQRRGRLECTCRHMRPPLRILGGGRE